MKSVVIAMCISLGCAGIASAESALTVEGRYWMPQLNADVMVDDDLLSGTEIDFQDDLGIGDQSFPEARVLWQVGEDDLLRFIYTQASYDGDETLVRTVNFGGQSYTVGARVESGMDILYLRLGWQHDFISLLNDSITIGSLVDAKAFFIDASLNAPTLAISESEEFIGGLPTIGATFDFQPIENVSVFSEISGMYAGSYGHLFDGEVGISIEPIEHFSLVGGYRIFGMQIELDSDQVELTLGGPFVGGSWRF
ncbi:hypothetical protein ACFL1E_03575 [Candidatus Omnitrophota bacterium]